MMATSIPEGTIFKISKSGLDLLGVVARRVPRGRVVAVYLFNWPCPTLDDVRQMPLPSPAEAGYKGKFVDHALRDQSWPSFGVHPEFRREQWPYLHEVHVDHFTGNCVMIDLDDRNPLKRLKSRSIACEEQHGMPSDVLRDPFNFTDQLPGSYDV